MCVPIHNRWPPHRQAFHIWRSPDGQIKCHFDLTVNLGRGLLQSFNQAETKMNFH